MNTQLAALEADARRAPAAPVPALHDQLRPASLLGDARSADLSFGAKSEPLHEERHPAGAAYPSRLSARLHSPIRRGHRRFSHCDFRGATTDGLTLIDCPADGADFRGAKFEEVKP